MREIDEAIELLKPVIDRCKYNDGYAADIVRQALALLESAKAGPTGNGWDDIPEIAAMLKDEAEPEAGEFTSIDAVHGELKYCKEHRTIHCSCQQREIDRLTEELKSKDKAIERLKHPNAKIICLCGSTRLTNEMLVEQWKLTKQGHVVLSWCALPESYFKGPHIGDAEGVKEIVDEVHKRKIDLSDEVFVINIGGYVGDSTRSEIQYAEQIGVPVVYLEQVLKEAQP